MSELNPEAVVSGLRETFNSGKTKPIEYRLQQLKELLKFFNENLEEIIQALKEDLNKPKLESYVMEISVCRNEIIQHIKNLPTWSKPEKVSKSMLNIGDSIYILHEPYGVVLIMGAWNYPMQVTLCPLIGAIAAGNCVVLKPSELSPATTKLMAKYLPKYLDSDAYQVYEGGVSETTELLKQKFDYIFYTGSSAVGKIVHAAAAVHLTPTTLELGGKSPVFLDASADIELSARRILWGKLVNSGQTCIAPDYLLCTKEVQVKFIEACKKVLKDFYQGNPRSSDYARIINERHFERITGLLKDCKIAIGGEVDKDVKYIAPTIVTDVKPSDRILKEEIFGPILPIVNVDNTYEAIKFVKNLDHPLAMYIFSENKQIIQQILNNTSAGGVCINDTIMHAGVNGVPFGGVGNSGMGQYHGKFSYETFTHKKPVLHKNSGYLFEKLGSIRYPPYTEKKLKTLSNILTPPKFELPWEYFNSMLTFFFGFAFALIIKSMKKFTF